LIFNAQRHRELVKESAFRIELIMPPEDGERILSDCSYLKNITPISELTEGEFAGYKGEEPLPDPDMSNHFAYWLREKIEYHRRQNELGEGALGKMMAEIIGETA